MLKIMVVGATSAIAHATMRHFAQDGAEFFLVARNAEKLQTIASDLTAYGAKNVTCETLDMMDMDQHEALLYKAINALDGLDAVFMAHGLLGDQKKCEQDFQETMYQINTNFVSAASLLTLIANYFEKQRRGTIAVITSVAGDRGRASNYIYGTAMAAKNTFLSGLRNRFGKSNVSVLTIKPGFVNTPMTAHLKHGLLYVEPEVVGKDIYHAMKKGDGVLYTPFFWRYIMWIIRAIPEPIFAKLRL